jgi:DNA-binding PadR family transcriptional regulator
LSSLVKAPGTGKQAKPRRNFGPLEGSALLTDFSRFYMLLLLYEGEKHGYQIMSDIEHRLGQRASPSLVYPFLRALEGQGLVRSRESRVGQKSRTVYSLTTRGRSLSNRLFKQFTMIVSSAIEPSMEVCTSCGCTVYKDAYSEVIEGKILRFCCKHCAAAYKRKE